MRKILPLAFLALLSANTPLAHAQETPPPPVNSFWPGLTKPSQTDPTSAKIIDLHIKARGGREAMEAVRSLRLKGKLFEGKKDFKIEGVFSPSGEARFEIFFEKRGDEHRTVKASDGKHTWQRVLLPEKERPAGITGNEGKLLDLEARLPFLLLDHVGQNHVFTYIGKKDYLGRAAYVLHGWLVSGLEIDIFLDAKSFQILNYRHPYKIGGREVLVNLTPSKLKRLGNVWWEMEYKMNHRNKTFRRVTYERIKLNVPTEDSFFAQPEIKEFWLRSSRN
ncbi:hypothetical protein G0Q06_12405 [Puniceicoccales bacterium CK1056]|uniref:Outer membrane lipoprotein-sorting protein n=1 Tax=Oceanipulchritudo coccoides TaxID=2706888 RepID=A0A6B2M4V0_9BACT|nr:hypothetical protein [Oceanipulchritudo coccoides]NDV63259.1 hypothetical protein [Oceanipulchritudo coccoides]